LIYNKGKREVLGVQVSLSEAEVYWRTFFSGLQKRGLHGIKLMISDAHSGIKAARKAVMPSVPCLGKDASSIYNKMHRAISLRKVRINL
jgi:transposase-like protein